MRTISNQKDMVQYTTHEKWIMHCIAKEKNYVIERDESDKGEQS